MVLRRIDVSSAAKLFGALYALLGVLIGGVLALVSLVGAGLAAGMQSGGGPHWLFGVSAIIWAPVCYGLIGLIGGALMAALYNLVSGFVGGVRLEMN